MDNLSTPAESQQAQLYYQQYQQQQHEATAPQAYDPSTQAYYASYAQYNQTPNQPQQETQYSYYYPDYSNSYQSQPQVETSSVQAPGVPIPAVTQETHVQSHANVYYAHGYSNPQQQQPQNVYGAPRHSTFAARGGRGGRSFRGGRRGGHSGSFRGRGRGRVQASASATIPGQEPQPPSAPGNAAAPPRMAWCELCRVDCTTAEVLEVHRNGKKHQKNVKIHEELQNLNRVSVEVQNPQPVPDSNVQAAQPEMNKISEASDNPESSGGIKRKAKGGRGGKWVRGHDGLRKAVGPPKPKQVTSLFCQLCNVKCETPVVFDSHMAGKKHLANVKRFEGHQAAFGGDVQALYPPIPNVPPTLFATAGQPHVSQAQAQAPGQAQVLASSLVNQQAQAQDPNAQAALVQLLNQHGIGDAQALLAQLVPFLLAQVQPNGTEPGNPAQPGVPAYGALAQVQPNGAAPGSSAGPGELDSCAPGAVTGPVLQDQTNSSVQAQISAGDNRGSETAADKSEGAIDKSDMGGLEVQGMPVGPSTVNGAAGGEQADVAGEKPTVAESDNGCKQDMKD